jgi:glycosyltransferase involved in cell wall biosynthesis
MALTILNVAYPLAGVSPAVPGGAEQVVAMLDEALVRAGHRSIVIASAGSRCRGQLVTTPVPPDELDDCARARAQRWHRERIAAVLARVPVDVVHLHGLDFASYLPPPGPPVVVTLHLPPAWYPPAALRPDRPRTHLVCVSASQRALCPAYARIRATVDNGVPLARLRPGRRKAGYAVAIGRFCPEKGFHHALDAATAAGVPLILAGAAFGYPEHRAYARDVLAPRLVVPHRAIGAVGPRRKRHLLAGARCLLVPSLAPETSSLVAMEALACGTPIIAFRSGALVDLVEDGRTGFLVDDVGAMARGIVAAGELDPEACRRAAEARCSGEAMSRRYLELYADLAAETASGQAYARAGS